MSIVQRVAQLFGAVFLLVGVVGLVTGGGMSMQADPAPALILGLFPVNLLHNVVHLLFGVAGIVAARSFGGARAYTQLGGMIYLLLAVLGFLPRTNTLFGLVPLGGADVWLHCAIGLALVLVGFTARETVPVAARA